MKKFLNEFKDFAIKGNVVNLAVGVIIGAAFQSLITSLTTNIFSPILGLLTGQNFDMLELHVLGVTIKYGAFITSLVNFIEMAFVVFLLIKAMNKIMSLGKKQHTIEAPTTKKCPFCMTDININATRCPSCTSQLEAQNI